MSNKGHCFYILRIKTQISVVFRKLFCERKMKSLGLLNGVGKYFSHTVKNLSKILAYSRGQTLCTL